MKRKNRKLLAILLGLALILQYSAVTGPVSVYAEEGPEAGALTKAEAEAPAPKEEEPAPKADPEPAPKEEPAPKAEEPAPKQEAEPAAPAEEAAPAANDTGTDAAPAADVPADEQGDEADEAGGQETVDEATDGEAAPAEGEISGEVAEDPAEEDAEDEDEDEGYPAVTLSKTVAGVTVTLEAPKGALPEGAKLKVVQITAGKYFEAVAGRLAAEGRELTDAVAFDVTPLDKDGKEIQPRKSVKVTFRNTGLDLAEGGSVDVFRVSDNAASVTEMGTSVATAGTQQFSTDHFTIYVSGSSTGEPSEEGNGENNSNSTTYVMEYGTGGNTLTLESTEHGEKKDNWNLEQRGNYCTFDTGTKVLTYVNTTQADTVVTVVHEYQHKNGKKQTEKFYITLKPQVFKVTFKVKDAGSTGFDNYAEISVTTGGSIAEDDIPAPPDKTGSDERTYTFDGWYSDESCSSDASFSNIRSSFAVYGRYVPLAKITFKKNISDDASIPDPIEAGEGTSVTLGAASTADWAFKEWNTQADGEGTGYRAGASVGMPEGGMTLYAQWAEKTDTVHIAYYRNWKNNDDTIVHEVDEPSGSRTTIWDGIPDPEEDGIFLGWSTVRKKGSVEYNPGQSITPDADMNLYAVWGEITEEDLDYDTPLHANGMTVPYNGSEYSVSGIVEGEATQYTGLVKVGHYDGHNPNQATDIYVDVSAIQAAGTNAGQYAMPVAAEIYTKKLKDNKPPKGQGTYVEITNNLLTIRPAEITVVTDDATRGYIQGETLTAGGTLSCEGCSDSTITHDGGTATLCAGETLNIRTTGSQEEIGWTNNTYEVDWGTPDGWGSGKSTASKYNYKIVEETLGKLEVVGKVKISFVDEDGSTLIEDQEYDYGTKAEDVTPPTATKAEDDDYTYAFDTWQPEIADVEEEATYTAVYKKVKARITFDLDGGKLNGDAGPITQKYTIGETIKVLDAPVKDGYDFVEWQGSSYQPGDDYEVSEAHTFKAIWKESPSQGGGSDDGDEDEPEEETSGMTKKTAAAAGTTAPAAPAATAEPEEAAPAAEGADVPETNVPETIVPEDEVPKANEVPEDEDWTLVNAALCALTVLGSLLALRRRREDEDGEDEDAGKARSAKIAGLVTAAASVIALLLTQDFGGAMAVADKWTVLMAALLGGQALSAALIRKYTK